MYSIRIDIYVTLIQHLFALIRGVDYAAEMALRSVLEDEHGAARWFQRQYGDG